jgi:calcium load-activated calcium channel
MQGKRLEDSMASNARDMAGLRFKLNMLNGLIMFASYAALQRVWGGVPVAVLPFSPPGWIANVTHRGLEGDDVTQCSAIFIYALAVGFIKPNIAKFAGWAPSRAAGRAMTPANTLALDKHK